MADKVVILRNALQNAAGWEVDFERLESAGRLCISCEYPEVASLADHHSRIKDAIDEYCPDRFTIDSLSAPQRISSPGTFREFAIGLSCHRKPHTAESLLIRRAA